jgi:hypothetical protein
MQFLHQVTRPCSPVAGWAVACFASLDAFAQALSRSGRPGDRCLRFSRGRATNGRCSWCRLPGHGRFRRGWRHPAGQHWRPIHHHPAGLQPRRLCLRARLTATSPRDGAEPLWPAGPCLPAAAPTPWPAGEHPSPHRRPLRPHRGGGDQRHQHQPRDCGRRPGLSAPRACGYAYRRYLSGCNAKEYLDAEYRASRHRYGVWQVEGGITRPWDFRRGRTSTVIPDGTTPGGRRYRCREIGSYARAQELLRQGQTDLDGTAS